MREEQVMKKLVKSFLVCMMTLTVLLSAYTGTSFADGQSVPTEIQDHLNSVAGSGYTLAGYAELPDQGWAFAVLQGTEGHNLLYIYRKQNGSWNKWLRTDRVVFQGEKELSISVSEVGAEHDFLTEYHPVAEPVVDIYQANAAADDPEKEYLERHIQFALVRNEWLLTYWEDFQANCAVRVKENELLYYQSWLGDYEKQGVVRGTIQRDIRYASIANIPHSLEYARMKVTTAPEIPAGTLIAENIKFTGGKKYDVYSGPGEDYLRGGNGKAAVSTNDWIQVFGRENGWIMIQYDITSDHMRIGWIREDALPKDTSVSDLRFENQIAHTAVQCTMTDDPLFSMTAVASIPADAEVKRLAVMGSWTYAEYYTGTQSVRGFIRSDKLTVFTEEQIGSLAQSALLASGPVAEGKAVTADTLKNWRVSCSYDATSGRWSVRFDSGRDYGYSVIVEDKSGMAWLAE